MAPEYVKLTRGGKEIELIDHGKTLAQLSFKSGENVTANKLNLDDIPCAPLLDSNDKLTPEAEKVFKSWFKQYSIDMKMTKACCCDFIKSCTGEPVKPSDDRITKLFAQYDHNDDDIIEEDGFLEFYS